MFSSHTCKHTISLLLSSIVAISLYGCPKPTTTKTDEPTTEQTTAQEPPSEPYISVGDGGFATYSEIPSDAAMPKAPAISSLTPAPKSYRDFNSKHFIGSYECTPCHNGIKDNDGNDISIETDWSSTMMANAARDPFWKAKVEQETQLHPQHKDLIADKCTVCHMPLANVESHKANKSPKLFGDGFLNAKHDLFPLAMSGVSCTLCHQIKDDPSLGTLKGFSGGYLIETFDEESRRKLYGPYMNVDTVPMLNAIGFTPTGSKHVTEAKLCSSCHNVLTAYVDEKGAVVPKKKEDYFPEQVTFDEWSASRYATSTSPQSCQWCHMARISQVKISDGPPWIQTRETFGRHVFVGGNTFMLQIMKDNKDLLGIQSNQFDLTITKTKEMLKRASLIEVTKKTFGEGRLLVQLTVKNKSGHKLPTGYPSRRVFIHFVVKDTQGKIWFESGKVLKNGHIVGVDADVDKARYEQHYDRITRPDQVQVYESVMANTQGEVTYTLLRAASYLKDNRLLPEGFDKQKAGKRIKVHGKALQDANFQGGSDVVTYDLRGFPKGQYKVDIALRYQSISYRSALDLFKQSGTSPYTKTFMALYMTSKQYVETLQSTSFEIGE
ncbi:MAG: hypothetical protein CL920_16985 [Deltaproteobacteria bacterium]|nr:hypothetical protein [Deltaproteobacteria bacterium]MBU50376.1 hypothetical protein [Deltaproteobacteria bacterium]